ncbi:hypothetical protein BGZ72_002073 [Mortierella alpina]|nr:hypothetical protein BGZ72_002073 [Mortierella alpina]
MGTTERIVIFCDGTWAGPETKTETNIWKLAKMVGVDMSHNHSSTEDDTFQINNVERGIKARYFPGVGHGGTFFEHLFNGATGNDLDDNCLKVYEYIVKHYILQTPQPEIWMFGFSRGAYTVRRVAGMIYNCGILKRRKNGQPVTTNDNAELEKDEKDLCRLAYQIFCSNDPDDHPKNQGTFRDRVSHHVPTPVKFMGLFDTVGSLGIPYLHPGTGLIFREFRDNKVSSVVEKVYHAVSIHERLWGFEPCHVLPAEHRTGPQFLIHERWFPGCHYDIGCHRFQVFPSAGAGGVLGNLLNPLSKTLRPNHVFSDLVLKWMLESVKEHSGHDLISDIDTEINGLVLAMTAANVDTGSGDIYDNPLKYGPLGLAWEKLIDNSKQLEVPGINLGGDDINAISAFRPIAETLWRLSRFNFQLLNGVTRDIGLNRLPFVNSALGVFDNIFRYDPFNDPQRMVAALSAILSSQSLKREFESIIKVLVQTRDRKITDLNASVVRYDEERLGSRTIGDLGRIDRPKAEGMYRSETYKNFIDYRNIML